MHQTIISTIIPTIIPKIKIPNQMMNKKSFSTVFFLLITVSMLTLKVAAEDDDDVAGEIATDLLIGAGIAICEGFVICKLFMTIFVLISLILFLIALCSGEITCADICNSRNARRGLTTGAGYSLARSFRRST